MGRLLVGVAIVIAGLGSADAAPKKKVRIESTPPGASVYLDSVEEGMKCTTPCSIDVEGEATVIVQLAGHKPHVEIVSITRKEKPPFKRSVTLVASLGKIFVEGPKGAIVTVDEEEKGKVPLEIELEAGVHALVITLAGKQIYAQPIEVTAGEELLKVTVPSKVVADPTVIVDDQVPEGDPKPIIRKPADPKRAGSIVALSLATSVGFRDFSYDNADLDMNADLNPEAERGQILAGPLVELWPGTLLGVRALRGLALVGRFQFKVNSQVVKKDNDMATGARTYWGSYEVSLRQRWVFGEKLGLEAGAGYVQDQHSFEGNIPDIELVPDADYKSVRIGGRVSAMLGQLEPYGALDYRIVMSGGALEKRFPGATASGLRAALGVGATFGKIGARLEGSLTRYTWTFKNDQAADGAVDSIKHVSLVVGYAY